MADVCLLEVAIITSLTVFMKVQHFFSAYFPYYQFPCQSYKGILSPTCGRPNISCQRVRRPISGFLAHTCYCWVQNLL